MPREHERAAGIVSIQHHQCEPVARGENPLTARVMVNRLWQHHFGRGIVRSPNNFGLQGDRPTHPELLEGNEDAFLGPAIADTLAQVRGQR